MPFQQSKASIGSRRVLLELQRLLTSDDGMGGQAENANGWQTVRRPWGRVTALDERQRESLQAMQIQGSAAYHVDIPYVAGVEPKLPGSWRLRWGTRTLEIHSAVDDEGRKRRLVVLATEVPQ